MLKTKKLCLFIAIPLIYIWHCTAKNFTTEQAREARGLIVAEAKKYIGCSYKTGAIGPDYFDCSGLIYTVYHDAAGMQMPRSVKVMYSRAKMIKTARAEEGDLVFFKTTSDGSISHVGIYIGKNQFIHCASEGNNTGVIVSSLREKYYAGSFASVGRVLPSGNYDTDEEENSPESEETIKPAGDSSGSGGGISVSNHDKWYKNLIFDATLFCDWNFFLPERLMLNYRGIALETNARYAGWKLQPGVGTIFRYNHGTKNFQMPIVFSLTFSDYIKFYAGPVINFGTPTLPDSNEEIRGSFFPGIIGLSFQTPQFKAGKVFLSLVQDVEYTVFNDTDGGALNMHKSVTTGLVFSTGIRVTLPGSNIFK